MRVQTVGCTAFDRFDLRAVRVVGRHGSYRPRGRSEMCCERKSHCGGRHTRVEIGRTIVGSMRERCSSGTVNAVSETSWKSTGRRLVAQGESLVGATAARRTNGLRRVWRTSARIGRDRGAVWRPSRPPRHPRWSEGVARDTSSAARGAFGATTGRSSDRVGGKPSSAAR